MGQLLERLERLGLFDSAMIIVTSDHGTSFWPNSHDQYVNARITGLVVGHAAEIAIAVGGRIRAVVPALPFKDQGLLFSAFIPEKFAPANPASVEIFSVGGAARDTTLNRLQIRYEAFRPH